MEVDDDPTGWGALPWAPTDRDRESNQQWDDLWGELRERYWETVPYTDGYGHVGTKEQVKDDEDRAWYEDRKKVIDEYDNAVEWQNTRLHKREYDERKNQIEEHGLGNVMLTPQTNGNFYYLKAEFPPDFVHLTNKPTQ